MTYANSAAARWDSVTKGAARVARGTAAGFLSGLIASWVTEKYREVESRPVGVRKQEQALAEAGVPAGETPASVQRTHSRNGDPTVKVAEIVSREFFDHPLSSDEQKIAGPVVHYASAAAAGAVYGGISELIPLLGIGLGIPYATALWVGRDAIALPGLGVTKPVTAIAADEHASAVASHFVYGITLDLSRRILRRIV